MGASRKPQRREAPSSSAGCPEALKVILLYGWLSPESYALPDRAILPVLMLSEHALFAEWRKWRDVLIAEADRLGLARPVAGERSFDIDPPPYLLRGPGDRG